MYPLFIKNFSRFKCSILKVLHDEGQCNWSIHYFSSRFLNSSIIYIIDILSQIILCCIELFVHHKMFSSIPGLSPLDANGTSYLSCDSQKDPWILPDAKLLLREQNLCWLRTIVFSFSFFFPFSSIFSQNTSLLKITKKEKRKKERKRLFFLKIGNSLIRKLRSQANDMVRMDSVCAVSQSLPENWLHVVELWHFPFLQKSLSQKQGIRFQLSHFYIPLL